MKPSLPAKGEVAYNVAYPRKGDTMPKTAFTIRQVATADAPALLAIYGEYIDTSITFELTLPSLEEFKKRIATISARYPYLVAEADGNIVGYAYAHEFKERAAYQWGAELSVYINSKAHGAGLGKRFYAALIELLRLQGVRTVYGIVTLPNEKSERLHASMGFSCAGVMHSSGNKAGAWHDVAWFEKQVGPYEENPALFKPLGEIDPQKISEILKNA